MRLFIGILLTGGMLMSDAAAENEDGTNVLCRIAKPNRMPEGAPRYSDVGMRLFRKKKDEAEIRAAKDFHITRAEWSYIRDAEYIKKVHQLGWAFQGTTNAVTNKAEHAMQKNGKPVLDHFGKEGRFWADMGNEAYREWLVNHMKEWIDLGADSIQRDEPTTCRRTPYPTAAAFFDNIHKRFRAAVDRKVCLSCNLAWNNSSFGGSGEQVIRRFDYGMAEFYKKQLNPQFLMKAERDARSRNSAVVYTGGHNMSTADMRLAVAGCYANGLNYIVPWDQFAGINVPRVFAKPEELADLYGFVRACGPYLDGYEAAASTASMKSSSSAGIANALAGGTAFTAIMVTSSKEAAFGLGGNGPNGDGGIPRLYLTRGGFSYNTLDGVKAGSQTGAPEITTFMHDGQQTITVYRNGTREEHRSHADHTVQARFGGGHLSVPLQGGRRNHAGDLAEVVIYNSALSDAEHASVCEYLRLRYLGGAAGGTPPDAGDLKKHLVLQLRADVLAKTHKDGQKVSRWPAATGHVAVVPTVRLPNGKNAAAPVFKTDVMNGRPVVRFDGTDDLLRIEAAGPVSDVLEIRGGSGRLCAFVRAKPGDEDADVMVHLVEWSGKPKPAKVMMRPARFFGGEPLKAVLLMPVPYDRAAHEKAEEAARKMLKPGERSGPRQAGAYAVLKKELHLKAVVEGEFTLVDVPALNPWGILVISQ